MQFYDEYVIGEQHCWNLTPFQQLSTKLDVET